MKVKVKIPAKINLTLDITGFKGGYHTLNSLVASVNIYDAIRLSKRNDGAVNVTFSGLPSGVSGENSLAKKAAELFMNEFSTTGADIEINRGIPAGGGLGGSSADAAGVLLGMSRLYGVRRDMSALANMLGSDTAYMLCGGYAVLKGRGEKIAPVSAAGKRLYLLFITEEKGVSSAECYKTYDLRGEKFLSSTEGAARLFKEGDAENFFKTLKNDLYPAAAEIFPEVEKNLEALKRYGSAVMTGSGSAVYGIYKTRRERNAVYKKLLPEYGKKLLKAHTVRFKGK